MIRLYVIVEGRTEEIIANKMLVPHLSALGGYGKTLHGPIVAEDVGLPGLRGSARAFINGSGNWKRWGISMTLDAREREAPVGVSSVTHLVCWEHRVSHVHRLLQSLRASWHDA